MFDPFNPDRPPLPPDDPVSHKLMHCVDGKRGYHGWHKNGDTPYVENPNWLACLPRLEDGRVLIDADSAVRLALLHSPDYQSQLETLYLSALDVSFERFRFQTQFNAGTSLFYTADGRDRTGTGESSSALELSTFPGARGFAARRLFAAGGELVVGFANSLIWQFSGPNTNAANTLLDFALVQPLLRGGGRDVILERLTIAERALLANVRQMELYRRDFYNGVTTGRFVNFGLSRRGGFFGGSGLEGFTGVGGGGFGRVGGFGGGFFGGGNGGFAGGAGAGFAGGYLGLLQTQQNLRNQRQTIAALRSSVAQLESFFRAGRIDYFQVEQARQALFNAQSQLLVGEQQYSDTIDNFKATLGLPPVIELAIDEQLTQPFQLIAVKLVETQNRITKLQESVGETIVEILEAAEDEDVPSTKRLPRPESERFTLSRIPAEDVPSSPAGPVLDAKATSSPPRRPGLVPIVQFVSGEAITARRTWSPQLSRQLQALQRVLKEADQIAETLRKRQAAAVRSDVEQLKQAVQDRLTTTERLRRRVYPRLREYQRDGRGVDQGIAEDARLPNGAGIQDPCVPLVPINDPSWAVRGQDEELPPGLDRDSAGPLDPPGTATGKRALESSEPSPGGMRPPSPDGESVPFTDSSPEDVLPIDTERLRQLPGQLAETLADIDEAFVTITKDSRRFAKVLDELLTAGEKLPAAELNQRLRDRVLLTIPSLLNELAANVLSLTLVQARARTETVMLTPMDLDWRSALATARGNRLDWMNARADLVDSWRLVQFNANLLESQLDVVFSGDISNVGDNPLKFRGSTGRLRVGMQFDAPLVRQAERNQYRQALIEYQQARRNFYQFEDQVATSLRTILRALDVNQLNFEFRRVAVEVAIAQVELARLRLQEPPKFEQEAQFGATTARDLVSALTDLLLVQNDFLSVWAS
ncbi:MAG TPA: TolC family protein, partial [Pirellulaceae bacterium]